MAYWFCPACHRSLFGRSHRVRSNLPSGTGNCPHCSAALQVHTHGLFWLLAVIGWLMYFIVAIVDRDLLSTMAARHLAVEVTPHAIGYIALALQLPLLVVGPRYEIAQNQT